MFFVRLELFAPFKSLIVIFGVSLGVLVHIRYKLYTACKHATNRLCRSKFSYKTVQPPACSFRSCIIHASYFTMTLSRLYLAAFICTAFCVSVSADQLRENGHIISAGSLVKIASVSAQPETTEDIMFKRSGMPLIMSDKAPTKKSANVEVESSSSNPDNNNNNNNPGDSKSAKKRNKKKQIARAGYDQKTHRAPRDPITIQRKPANPVKIEYHDYGELGSMVIMDGRASPPRQNAPKPPKKGKKKQDSSTSSSSAHK